jgi:glycylpeptide N-tetradecanoyltransferase
MEPEAKKEEGTSQNKFEPTNEEVKQSHKFWDTQPVPRLSTVITKEEEVKEGPIDPLKTVAEIRQTPYNLPDSLEWVSVDVFDDEWMQEVYTLLTENYVEDDDSYFRFDYSIPFLRWALTPEGFIQDWHVGVAVKGKKKLVGFITGIPANVNVYGTTLRMAEINFLCVFKKYRTNRLAPVLIKEITRRVNVTGGWQAIYTAGVVLPSPIAQARYYHRSLNPVKLVEIGFTRFSQNLNKARAQKLYRLPENPMIPGIREFRVQDSSLVHRLLMDYLQRFSLHVEFTEAEIRHFFSPREDVIYSYVIENAEGVITDFLSFYSLPSSVLKNPKHKKLRAAYAYYVVPGSHSLLDLFKDMLILAKAKGFDVFNAVDIMDNMGVFKELKFGIGDGNLQYYLYNWRSRPMVPAQVGVVLV